MHPLDAQRDARDPARGGSRHDVVVLDEPDVDSVLAQRCRDVRRVELDDVELEPRVALAEPDERGREEGADGGRERPDP